MIISEKGTAAMVKKLRSEGSESRATYLELMQKRITELEQQLKTAKHDAVIQAANVVDSLSSESIEALFEIEYALVREYSRWWCFMLGERL